MDLVKKLDCPVCRKPMDYIADNLNDYLPSPTHFQCGHCGTIVPEKAIAALTASGERGILADFIQSRINGGFYATADIANYQRIRDILRAPVVVDDAMVGKFESAYWNAWRENGGNEEAARRTALNAALGGKS